MNCCRTLRRSKRLLEWDQKLNVLNCNNCKKSVHIAEKVCANNHLFITANQFNSRLFAVGCPGQQQFFYRTSTKSLGIFNSGSSNGSNGKKASTLGSLNNSAPLTKLQADDLILRLTEDERKALLAALQEYNSNQIKAEYEGQLAATRWRSKFGRPSKLPTLGDVDPTGSFCHLPDDWLKKKYAEKVPPPTGQQLLRIGIFNAVPFVGFGFLDNFIMIVAGDYIDETLGSLVTISTMAAAALGNTISDVMGIGSAWYVELAASKVGLKPPNLSPVQLDMKPARRAANLGRALGIIVGCLLGMLPLLFMSKEDVRKKEKSS